MKRVSLNAVAIALFLLVCLGATANAANPFVHSLFTSHMVLQRDASDPIWGWTTAGNTVTVTVKDQTNAVVQTKSAVADAGGRWQANIGPFGLVANNAAYSVVVAASGQTTTTLTDVLIGDVFLCSGQSNMAHILTDYASLDNVPGLYADDIADSVNYPNIRNYTVPGTNSLTPLLVPTGGTWAVSGTATTGGFTATGYFFARELYKKQSVPIGIVCSAVGGTTIKYWIDLTFASSLADLAKPLFDQSVQSSPTNTISCLFNGAIAPLAPFGIRGALWYQGESDAAAPEQYSRLLPGMMQAYRNNFGQPNLPFIIVQLPNYMTAATKAVETGSWAEIRESQLNTVLSDPYSRLVTTIDIGDAANLHPTDKPDVGQRAALAALDLVYGQNVVGQGPICTGATVSGSTITCTFSNVGGGLMVGRKTFQATPPSQFLLPVQPVVGGTLTGFALSGTNNTFYFANAVITGSNTVVVTSSSVTQPTAVRYGWAYNPACNLYGKITDSGGNVVDGLPASPFRNDPVYNLNVNGGTGTGYYALNSQVAISGSSISGETFHHWSGDTNLLSGTSGATVSATISKVYSSVAANYQVTGAPTGLASTPQVRQVALSWNAMSLVHYNIKRAAQIGDPYATIAPNLTGTTRYTDSAVVSGSLYYYAISAVGPIGEGPDSAPINAGPLFSVQATAASAQVPISWPAYNGTVTSYNVKRATSVGGPYTTIATGLTSLNFTDTNVVSGVTYYYIVTGVNAGVETLPWVQASALPSFLPPPLVDQDIGTVPIAGGAYADAAGNYTVVGSGSNLITTADSFNFAYTTLSGTGSITARVISHDMTGTIPRAGVMIRASLAPDAVNVMMLTTTNGYTYQARKTVGAVPAGTGITTGTNKWVRVTRTGNAISGYTMTGYLSPDGVTWTQVGNPQGLPMPDPVYVGLAVCAQDNTVVHRATFDNVTAPWTLQSPAVPADVSATVSSTRAFLTWDATVGAAGYNVKRTTTPGGPYTTVASGINAVSYTCTGLTSGVKYFYVISAVDSVGESANSSEIAVDLSSVTTQPCAPSGVNATSGSGQIILSWDTSPIATGYNVKRATSNGGPYSIIASPASSTWTDSGRTNTTTYYYVVSALTGTNESVNSAQVAATPQAGVMGCNITASVNGKYVTATGTAPLIGIKTTVGVNEYFAIVDLGNGQLAVQSVASGLYVCASNSTTQLVANHFSIGSTETYISGSMGVGKISLKSVPTGLFVCAEGAGNSPLIANRVAAGGYETFMLGGTGVTSTPVGLSASGGDSAATLSWSAALGATGYSVKRSATSGGPYVQIGTPYDTSYTDTGLTNGVTYYYVVSTVNSGSSATSGNSSEVSVGPAEPSLATPTLLSATALSETQIRLSWINNAPAAAAYVVQRSPQGTGVWTTLSSSVAPGAQTYTDSSAVAASSYDYRVQCTGSAPSSAFAIVSVATPAGIGDGIPGSWRLQYFGNGLTLIAASAADADPDNDGMSNRQEYLSATNPCDPANVFRIKSAVKNGNDAVIGFSTVAGKTYAVQKATSLDAGALWTSVQDNVPGTGGTVTITDTGAMAQPKRFYQVISVVP